MIGRPQKVKKPLSDLIMGTSRTAGGGNCLRTVLINDLLHAFTDLGQSLVPGNFLPFIFSATADTFARIIQPTGMIKIFNYIAASRAAIGDGIGRFCPRKIFIRLDGDQPSIINAGSQPAGIMTLDTDNFFGFHDRLILYLRVFSFSSN